MSKTPLLVVQSESMGYSRAQIVGSFAYLAYDKYESWCGTTLLGTWRLSSRCLAHCLEICVKAFNMQIPCSVFLSHCCGLVGN
jgi:hypothetical protein